MKDILEYTEVYEGYILIFSCPPPHITLRPDDLI